MTHYTLFSTVVFLSSFLLFQVQPLISKHLLPWYGGSSAVWIAALLFFMVALAVGYVYVLFLARLRPTVQLIVHGGLVVATILLLYGHAQVWPSGITPPYMGMVAHESELLAILLTLTLSIGLPFILLSTTSSLLQLWYGTITKRDPSSLYSISNIGSLLGLISYPFLFEPLLSTTTLGNWWVTFFLLYVGLLSTVGYLVYRAQIVTLESRQPTMIITRDFLIWMVIASIPVFTLLAGTSHMTTTIAPIPLLWVGPLTLYLVSFIWSFRAGRQAGDATTHEMAVLALCLTGLTVIIWGIVPVIVTLLILHALLLAVFHWCHEYLYRTRPTTAGLPRFYVALSLGGILGSLTYTLLSTVVLPIPFELIAVCTIAPLVVLFRWRHAIPPFFPLHIKTYARVYILLLLFLVSGTSSYVVYAMSGKGLEHARNFFGYKAIVEYDYNKTPVRTLQHGMTNHGFQVKVNGELTVLPAAYYGKSGGVGQVFSYLNTVSPEKRTVAVIGLGSGGLAAYCRPGDQFTFIEIDPQVIRLAYDYFTYLSSCTEHTVQEADGRLALKSAEKGTFDLIILDAYADDMMPVHLMSKEAIGEYVPLLTDEGMIAMNISSRYLNLLPVAAALARENNLAARTYFDRTPSEPTTTSSQWVIFAKDESVFTHEAFAAFSPITVVKEQIWSDTYSALLPVIVWGGR